MKNSQLILLVLSLIAGAILEGIIPPKISRLADIQYRQLFSESRSAGEQATAVKVSIVKIEDSQGNPVWQSSKWVSVCSGDTVTIGLETPGSGHISRFEIVDPFTDITLSVTNPSTYKSDVVKYAEVTFRVPPGTTKSEINVLWSADIFIIEPDKNENSSINTKWFQIIAPYQLSGTSSLKLVTPDARLRQVRQKERNLYPQFYKFLVVAALAGLGLVICTRNLNLTLIIFGAFAGFALMFIAIGFEELNYNGSLFLGTLAGVGVVVFLLIRNLRLKRY